MSLTGGPAGAQTCDCTRIVAGCTAWANWFSEGATIRVSTTAARCAMVEVLADDARLPVLVEGGTALIPPSMTPRSTAPVVHALSCHVCTPLVEDVANLSGSYLLRFEDDAFRVYVGPDGRFALSEVRTSREDEAQGGTTPDPARPWSVAEDRVDRTSITGLLTAGAVTFSKSYTMRFPSDNKTSTIASQCNGTLFAGQWEGTCEKIILDPARFTMKKE